MEDQKPDSAPQPQKQALDARLLNEAIVEFNISRRNSSLYPPGHIAVKNSLAKAHGLFKRICEVRPSITLGIAKDTLLVDEYEMDKHNPIFRECAKGFHDKGLSSVTFYETLVPEELQALNLALSDPEGLNGRALVEHFKSIGIKGIELTHIDYSNFAFIEDAFRQDGQERTIWADYVSGLLGGKLQATPETSDILVSAPVEGVAMLINAASTNEELKAKGLAYDQVIASYISAKKDHQLSAHSLEKLFTLMDNLTPEIKKQFLTETFKRLSMDIKEVEQVLGDLTQDSFEHLIKFFTQHSAALPSTLKTLINKIGSIHRDKTFQFDFMTTNGPVVHDIDISDDMAALFDEDHYGSFVSTEYQKELEILINVSSVKTLSEIEAMKYECNEDVIERVTSEIMVEVLDSPDTSMQDSLDILSRLSELALEFVDTGRFEDCLNVYISISSQQYGGVHANEAQNTVAYFFRSERFLHRFVDAVKLWGKKDRIGASRMLKALKGYCVGMFLDSAIEEKNATTRKFMLLLASELGDDIMPEVLLRLKDSRWYMVRNMLYLIRLVNISKYADHARVFVKHQDSRLSTEAMRTLLHFNAKEAFAYLKMHMLSDSEGNRSRAIVLAGSYRVKEAVPIFIEMLSHKKLFGEHVARDILLVKALGQIGDRMAIDALVDVFKHKGIFYRQHQRELRLAILNSLALYPPQSVKPLLELARRSSDSEIKAVGERMHAQLFREQE